MNIVIWNCKLRVQRPDLDIKLSSPDRKQDKDELPEGEINATKKSDSDIALGKLGALISFLSALPSTYYKSCGWNAAKKFANENDDAIVKSQRN